MKFDTLPHTCLVDETVAIRVLGLQPGERVSLKLWSSFNQTVLLSSAIFIADSKGVVDLSSHAPQSGSYAGVDAMGLFWSRAPVDNEVAKGFETVSSDPLMATLTAEAEDGGASISHSIRRVYLGPGVVSREVRADGLFGKMFEPAEPGPHRAVLVVGGSNGGLAWSQEMAALLASHGYAALALAYFAAEGLPQTLDRIPLEYFGTALAWLSTQSTVISSKMGVVGVSRGGELALLLGATYPEVRAVIAYVPSGIAWPSYPESGYGAWTAGGQEVPYARTLTYEQWDAAIAAGSADEDSFDWYFIPLKDAAYADRAAIRVENINGPVLMVTGSDDKVWPSTGLTEFAVKRFERHGFRHRVEHLAYEKAGHSIAWPNGPTTMLKSKHPVSGEDIDMGGTPEGTARARQHSWPRMLAFLSSAFSDD